MEKVLSAFELAEQAWKRAEEAWHALQTNRDARNEWEAAMRVFEQATADWNAARHKWKAQCAAWERAQAAWEAAEEKDPCAETRWLEAKQAWEQARRSYSNDPSGDFDSRSRRCA